MSHKWEYLDPYYKCQKCGITKFYHHEKVEKCSNITIEDAAKRWIQDQEFVNPGETITLSFHEAIEAFKAGYRYSRGFNIYEVKK